MTNFQKAALKLENERKAIDELTFELLNARTVTTQFILIHEALLIAKHGTMDVYILANALHEALLTLKPYQI